MGKSSDFFNKLGDALLNKGVLKAQYWVMVVSSIVVFVLTIVTVVLRYIFKVNIMGLDEVILLAVMYLYFFGAAQGSFENSHIKAGLIETFCKNRIVVGVDKVLVKIVELAVVTICFIWSIQYLKTDLATAPVSPGLKIPMFCNHLAVFIGFLFMIVTQLGWLFRELGNLLSTGKEAAE